MQDSTPTSTSKDQPRLLSSLFRIWCTRTHSHGEKRVRIYEDEMGKKHTSSMHTVVAEYPMPFSFVETSVTNTSINIQVVDSNVQVIAISVVLCNYLNQVVPDGLQTKYDRRPQTILEWERKEDRKGMYVVKYIGFCKTSAQIYKSNIADFSKHMGALVHPVLLIETNVGLLESHLPDFWCVSICPHRQREIDTFRTMAQALRLCDSSVPTACAHIPNTPPERRRRGGDAYTRRKYILELTDYLDMRSKLIDCRNTRSLELPQGMTLASQNRDIFMWALSQSQPCTTEAPVSHAEIHLSDVGDKLDTIDIKPSGSQDSFLDEIEQEQIQTFSSQTDAQLADFQTDSNFDDNMNEYIESLISSINSYSN